MLTNNFNTNDTQSQRLFIKAAALRTVPAITNDPTGPPIVPWVVGGKKDRASYPDTTESTV